MSNPAVIKILKYLSETKERKSPEQLAAVIHESPELTFKTLEKLSSSNLVTRDSSGFSFNATPKNIQALEDLFSLHEEAREKPDKDLLMRGVLCIVPCQYLIHLPAIKDVFLKEGISESELNRFLEMESSLGYLQSHRITYLKKKLPFAPVCMPARYFEHLTARGIICRDRETGLLEKEIDSKYQEETYLSARYPEKLEKESREYIEKNRPELKSYLRRKGMAEWNQ